MTRSPSPKDSRAQCVVVTDEGAELARQAIAVVEAADERFFSPAGGRDEVLNALLRLSGYPGRASAQSSERPTAFFQPS